ncbi:MAG: GH3 auxin-responsive promoter family protein [Bacteroidia bacterium]
MALFGSLLNWYLKKREPVIRNFMENPHEVQETLLKNLIEKSKNTEWGKKYDYKSIESLTDFKNRVPVGNYETHKPYINRLLRGEQNILWPSEVRWFAKSSGTTSSKSKFIPITNESLDECHFQGGKDAVLFYLMNHPDSNILNGKGLIMGGSHQVNRFNFEQNYYGDLSAVMMQNLPFWAHFFRTPDLGIALMDDWEEKIEKMAKATVFEEVTSICGVPTWTLVLIEKLFELSGKNNLADIWPDLELYIHGGVSFTPYREKFRNLIRSSKMNYLETYNASEGFLGIQDMDDNENMLLMLDYGIYYEFMPMQEYGKEHPETLSLEQIEPGVNYAIVVSSNSGLWRYAIGDTVKFSEVKPFRFKITGRTKHFINAFGEELVIENADHAISNACKKLNADIIDYTAAPVYFSNHQKGIGAHEWLIEFDREPYNIEHFVIELDQQLKIVNSDYEAKRFRDMAMTRPIVHVLPRGTFKDWLKRSGKLGGQHKVPRLSNSRQYVDEILKMNLMSI